MSKFNPGQLGDWVLFCDICGQKCYASESSKLPIYTGRGGLIVCHNDVDKVDYGLVPYKPRREENVPYTRINHTSTIDGSPIFDLEELTVGEISSLQFIGPSQLDNVVIAASQDENIWIASSQGQ